MANFLQIGLFFCLCSYYDINAASHHWTVHLYSKKVQLYNNNVIIYHDVSNHTFLSIWDVTLFIDTQKNSIHGESSTMKATGIIYVNPVTVVARCYLHLLYPQHISIHSDLHLLTLVILPIGGMTSPLDGVANNTVKIVIRQWSYAFPIYLQGHIIIFVKYVSTAICYVPWVWHMDAPTPSHF